jgi:hypothetical protein
MAENPILSPGDNLAPTGFHLHLDTRSDNKQVKLNSRDFTQASGSSIAFQSKPSQTVDTTGDVIGGEISPRVQSGIDAGQLKGLHIDTDMKGTGARTVSWVKGLELEFGSDAGSNVTVTNDAVGINLRNFLQGVTVTGDVAAIRIQNHEGVAYTCFAKFEGENAGIEITGASASIPANTGYLLIKVGSTLYRIPIYANS